MPIGYDKEDFSDRRLWFPRECESTKVATEELLWSLKHALLADECAGEHHGVIAKSEPLRVEFDALEKKWKRETKHLSLISKKVAHPAYLRIIALGEPAIPLLLEALRDRPSHWFAALQAISNADPCHDDATPSEARIAWLEWGMRNGYIDRQHV
jgi:hypothetical protein